MLALVTFCLLHGMHGAASVSEEEPRSSETSMRIDDIAERLQRTVEDIVLSNLQSSLSGGNYASGSAKDKLAELAKGKGMTMANLNLAQIVAMVAKKVSELAAPILTQVTEMGSDFDTILTNSRDKTKPVAAKCGTWPTEKGWLRQGSSFSYPEGAQRIDSRPREEFCRLFPEIQSYLSSMQMKGVHLVEYVTPKGEYFVRNMRDTTTYQLPDQFDGRTLPWYVESSNLAQDLVFLVSMPQSLKISLGADKAVTLMEGVFNATLSLLGDEDQFQVVISGYSNPCFSSLYLVPATRANKIKAVKFLREQISRHMPMGDSTVSAATRLAYKLLSDSARDGFSTNCSLEIVHITDGLIRASEVEEALLVVKELQAVGPAVQISAISLGPDECALCEQIVCPNQGVHMKVADIDSPSFYRSKVRCGHAVASAKGQQTRHMCGVHDVGPH